MSTYRYVPLEASKRQIRLLHLLPSLSTKCPESLHGIENTCILPANDHSENNTNKINIDYTDEIHCTFSLVSLDDEPEYEALSYVWGDQEDLATIYVHNCPFLITRNLYDALLHMRQTGERVLWADALCINQADLAEQASQVLQMGSIYRQASTVVVYLGAWKDAEIAFRFIEAYVAEPTRHYYDALSMSAAIQAHGLDVDADTAKRYLTDFFNLPWWSRVWTVQEYILAKEAVFQSGKHLLKAAHVNRLKQTFSDHHQCCIRGGDSRNSWIPMEFSKLFTSLVKSEILVMLKRDDHRERTQPFWIAAIFRDRRCLNPLDKVYGVLGLAHSTRLSRVRPDYRSTPRAVYTRAAITWIQDSQSLDVLSWIYGERSHDFDVPTYIPDLSTEVDPDDETQHLLRCHAILPHFRAALDSAPIISVSPLLEAATKAIFIDTVLKTVDDEVYSEWVSDDYQDHVSANAGFSTRYDSHTQACWHTICGGAMQSVDTSTGQVFYRLVEDGDYAAYQRWRAWDGIVNSSLQDWGVVRFHDSAINARSGRSFAVTNKGYLGLIPRDARPGDHVVIMPGGKVPYVIRRVRGLKSGRRWKKGDSVRRYEFIGDCYIHGIMHGEAWDESKIEPIVLV